MLGDPTAAKGWTKTTKKKGQDRPTMPSVEREANAERGERAKSRAEEKKDVKQTPKKNNRQRTDRTREGRRKGRGG